MREIAAAAGLPISTLYQYFADKNQILEAIMNETFESFRVVLAGLLGGISSKAEVLDQFESGVDLFYKFMRRDPALVTIWAGITANTKLRDMDIRDNIRNARSIADFLCKLAPRVDRKEAVQACSAMAHTVNSAVRLALLLGDKEGRNLVNEVKKMTRLRLAQLIGV